MQIYSVKVDWCNAQEDSLLFSFKAKMRNESLTEITAEYNWHYTVDHTRMTNIICTRISEVLKIYDNTEFEIARNVEQFVKEHAEYRHMTLNAFNKKYND